MPYPALRAASLATHYDRGGDFADVIVRVDNAKAVQYL
jgi:hypothetical protein